MYGLSGLKEIALRGNSCMIIFLLLSGPHLNHLLPFLDFLDTNRMLPSCHIS